MDDVIAFVDDAVDISTPALAKFKGQRGNIEDTVIDEAGIADSTK